MLHLPTSLLTRAQLGQDREALNTMITTSHDIHLGKLLTKVQ